jgi:hypothetical protein
VTVYVIADGAVVAIRAATGTPGRVIPAGTDPERGYPGSADVP